MGAVAVDDALVADVIDIVRRHRFVSRSAVRAQLQGRKDRRSAAIDLAVASGQVWEGPGYYPARGGARRSGQGLHAAPVVSIADLTMRADELRTQREAAGVSQASLARRLSVSRVLIVRWEQGQQRIPGWAPERIRQGLADGPDPERPRRDLLAEYLPLVRAAISDEGGLTLRGLEAKLGTNSEGVRRALHALLEENAVHVDVTWRRNRNGISPHRGYYLGPEPARVTPPAPAEVRAARKRARWTQEQMAARLSVSTQTFAKWEKGHQPIPYWAASGVWAAVHQAMTADVVDLVAEAGVHVRAAVAAHPEGISRKALRRELRRHDAPFAEAIEAELRAGRIHEDHTGRQGGRCLLYAGPAVPRLSAAKLAGLRLELGWTQAELAQRTGIDNRVMSLYERGDRPIPQRHRRLLLGVLADGERAMATRHSEVLRSLELRPIARGALEGIVSAPVVERWIRTGAAHEAEQLVTTSTGRRRAQWMVAAGPPTPPPVPMTGAELEAMRCAAGFSCPQLAVAVGLHHSGSRIWHWEQHPSTPIPGPWAAEIRSVLAGRRAGPPRTKRRHASDAEVAEWALAIIRAEPGQLSQTQLVQRLDGAGSGQRRAAILGDLERRGRLHRRPLTYRDSTGRRQTKLVYELGKAR